MNNKTEFDIIHIEPRGVSGITLLTAAEAEQLPTEVLQYPCSWWTRSPGNSPIRVACVHVDCRVYRGHGGEIYYSNAIRPVLTVPFLQAALNPDVGDIAMIAGKQYKVIAPNRILYADSPLRRSFIWDELNNSYETSLVKILADHWLELPEEEFDPARQRGARSEYDLLAPTDQATIKLIIQQGWAPPPKWWSAPVNSGPNSSGHTTT